MLRSTFTRAPRAKERRETWDMRHYVKKRIHKGIDGQKTYVLRETMGRTHYGVIKNHNYEGANDRRKQFYRGSTLPEILHTGWPVGKSPHLD